MGNERWDMSPETSISGTANALEKGQNGLTVGERSKDRERTYRSVQYASGRIRLQGMRNDLNQEGPMHWEKSRVFYYLCLIFFLWLLSRGLPPTLSSMGPKQSAVSIYSKKG